MNHSIGREQALLFLTLIPIFLFAACDTSVRAPIELAQGSRRTLAQGSVVGIQGHYDNHAWLGIPFAQQPTGDLRWRAPRPAAPWTGELEASRFAPPCPQLASPLGGVVDVDPGTVTGDESCLYLNVYAPTDAIDQAEPLAVMFWIHGGGNTIGHTGFYDGGNLAATENVIVVTTQYRLGPLGWLHHEALQQKASSAERSGNFGTLDLIRGLEWVRENIGAFGGDPNRVTIFGESAGARNVISLLISPAAQGLFHGAIAQSGGASIRPRQEARNLTTDAVAGHANSSGEILLRLAQRDGHAADRQSAIRYIDSLDESTLANYLRAKSAGELLREYQASPEQGLIDVPNVFGDGVVIAAGDAVTNLSRATSSNVPAILGTNKDEQKIFLFADPAWTKRWFGILPRVRDTGLYMATADSMSRLWAVRGVVEPANARLKAGAPTYAYRWDWDEEPSILGSDLSMILGAAHGLEIPFVFGHFELGPQGNVIFSKQNEPGRKALSRAMMSYWANFARTGKPDRGSDGTLPLWNPWSADGAGRIQILDTDAGGGIRGGQDLPSRLQVFSDLKTDQRLESLDRRCVVYDTMLQWSQEIDERTYRELGCKRIAPAN